MLQRVQSLYLVLSFAMVCASFFIPFGSFTDGTSFYIMRSYGIKADGHYLQEPSSYMIYLALSVAMAITAIALGSYNNRILQIRLIRLSFLAFAISFGLLIFYLNGAQAKFPGLPFTPGLSIALIFVALIFNWLAARSIKKDEELVRSTDRIR